MLIPNAHLSIRLLLISLLCFDPSIAVKWLALYKIKHKSWDNSKNCSKSIGLVPRQVKMCKENLDLMETVALATSVSVETCQSQFADRRWNCSSIQNVPSMSRDLVRGTREQAYVYGISSAALVHSVARACSIGVTTKCSCGALPNSNTAGSFKWGGCGDDVNFGLHFAEAFTNSGLKSKKGNIKTSKKAMMNKHNFAAGRKVVTESLITACKCHGVSGSCSIKTCWKALTDFETIGASLKDRYALAVEVRRKRKKKMKVLVPIRKNIRDIRDDQLIYYTKSPDYCSPDEKTGSIGTHGRFCDDRSYESGGCDSMCCGRGFHSFTMEVVERCECKYYWCCYVKCKTCHKTLELSRCR
ncbi:protein Wnt-11b-2-like [Haliotis asinina]|uniref:protein Wnt-11b-2-like n=1 Tax=Haliotis asinina TaxID=109174 RepID=UPI00353242F6